MEVEIAHRSEMSTARVRLKFGEILNQTFCAGAANVIFRYASTGVWATSLGERKYASSLRASTVCTREYARVREYARKVCGPYI